MKEIVFYTTQHCGLCEAAMDALLALPEAQGSQLRTVDIALDDDLMAQYGTRILCDRRGRIRTASAL